MTVKELIQVAYNAQSEREESWNDKELKYSLTHEQAVAKRKPIAMSAAEEDIAAALNRHLWNEVQEWYHQLP